MTWKEFLGDLINGDPDKWEPAKLKPWRAGLDMIEGLGVSGFSSGLTPFQAAHTLSIFGLLSKPTSAEMALWIEQHHMGARTGLSEGIGFALDSANPGADVQASFLILHGHLDGHLSVMDKHDLRFGTIFLEHVLCKVCRWARLLKHGCGLDLWALGQAAEAEMTPWTSGANESDHTAFPFPLTISLSQIENALSSFGYVIHFSTSMVSNVNMLQPFIDLNVDLKILSKFDCNLP